MAYKKRTLAEQWNIDRPRIHALKNKVMALPLGFSDDNYRDMISDISQGRTDSSKGLKPVERQELIDRLSQLAGEEPRKPWQSRDKKSYPGRPKNMNHPGKDRGAADDRQASLVIRRCDRKTDAPGS